MLAGDVDPVELEVAGQKGVYARPWLLGSKRKRRPLTWTAKSSVPVPTLSLVEVRIADELEAVKWMGLIVEFAFPDLAPRPVYVRYRIRMADRNLSWP